MAAEHEQQQERRPVLWHLPLSHYSEKVRWALDYKRVAHDRHAPVAGCHIPVAIALTKGRHYTLPVIKLDGRRIGDSTAIIAALEQRHPDSALYPSDPAQRRRALALEDWFDEHLGPAVRRFAFHALRSDREQFDELASSQVPPALAEVRDSLAQRPGYLWVQTMFARHRAVQPRRSPR